MRKHKFVIVSLLVLLLVVGVVGAGLAKGPWLPLEGGGAPFNEGSGWKMPNDKMVLVRFVDTVEGINHITTYDFHTKEINSCSVLFPGTLEASYLENYLLGVDVFPDATLWYCVSFEIESR